MRASDDVGAPRSASWPCSTPDGRSGAARRMVRVKVCGITESRGRAWSAVDAGADALGFIFVESTPRFVTPAQVAPIVRALPPFVTPVGVFWDHPAGHVKAVAEACGLRALQFHGDEKPEDLDGYALPVIKTIKLPARRGAGETRRGRRATGRGSSATASARRPSCSTAPRAGARARPASRSSGRLARALHRAEAGASCCRPGSPRTTLPRRVATVRPYAVDVNSGVEAAPGRKDPDKVLALRGRGAAGGAACRSPGCPTRGATSAATAGASCPRR